MALITLVLLCGCALSAEPATKKVRVGRSGQPSEVKNYPDGDIRNDPMGFILNSAELHISYVGEQPDVRAEIRAFASQIKTATPPVAWACRVSDTPRIRE